MVKIGFSNGEAAYSNSPELSVFVALNLANVFLTLKIVFLGRILCYKVKKPCSAYLFSLTTHTKPTVIAVILSPTPNQEKKEVNYTLSLSFFTVS
jgi:hypothetical protein